MVYFLNCLDIVFASCLGVCYFIKMFPVKIYVVPSPLRHIFGPNLSDTLIILLTLNLNCILFEDVCKSKNKIKKISKSDSIKNWNKMSHYELLLLYLCECKYVSSCLTFDGIFSRNTDKDMAYNMNCYSDLYLFIN